MTAAQKRALAALIQGPTIEAAAKAANVGYTTLRRWLKDNKDFQTAYRASMSELLEGAENEARRSLSSALSVLKEIMEDSGTPPPARIQAARSVLEYGLRLVEAVDIDRRVSDLEEVIR